MRSSGGGASGAWWALAGPRASWERLGAAPVCVVGTSVRGVDRGAARHARRRPAARVASRGDATGTLRVPMAARACGAPPCLCGEQGVASLCAALTPAPVRSSHACGAGWDAPRSSGCCEHCADVGRAPHLELRSRRRKAARVAESRPALCLVVDLCRRERRAALECRVYTPYTQTPVGFWQCQWSVRQRTKKQGSSRSHAPSPAARARSPSPVSGSTVG